MLKVERMVYSMNAVNALYDMVKKFNVTTRRKSEHGAKYNELRQIFEFASEHVNSFLFDPDYKLKGYGELLYRKNATKKDIDNELKRVFREIKWDIMDIYTSIQKGEVEAI